MRVHVRAFECIHDINKNDSSAGRVVLIFDVMENTSTTRLMSNYFHLFASSASVNLSRQMACVSPW